LAVKRWEAFCAYPFEDCEKYLLEAFKELKYNAKIEETTISNMQDFMLGTEGNVKKIIFQEQFPFEFKIISVSQDPLYRLFMSLFSSHKKESITLLSMTPFTPETESIMFNVMQNFFKRAPEPPWEIKHPRFKLSIILNYQNKRKWNCWIA